jgi:hypothetical protein
MTYSGAPDECTYHFVWGADIVKLVDGECPKQAEHKTFGPAANYEVLNLDSKPVDHELDYCQTHRGRCDPNYKET